MRTISGSKPNAMAIIFCRDDLNWRGERWLAETPLNHRVELLTVVRASFMTVAEAKLVFFALEKDKFLLIKCRSFSKQRGTFLTQAEMKQLMIDDLGGPTQPGSFEELPDSQEIVKSSTDLLFDADAVTSNESQFFASKTTAPHHEWWDAYED